MARVLISLFIVFSLLVAPMAHAAGMGCAGDNCQMSEIAKKSAKDDKQDKNKMADAAHHCCCSHVTAIPDSGIAEPKVVSSRTVFTLEQDATTSVVVGPPLKPPYHA